MELGLVKGLLEKDSSKLERLSERFFDLLVMAGLQIDLIEPGRLICSMKVPPRLLNNENRLHEGATATLVDLIGSAVIFTVGAPVTGVSVEMSISYMDTAYVDEEIEIEAKSLHIGKAVGVVTVEIRKKRTGKIIAHGRQMKFIGFASKI